MSILYTILQLIPYLQVLLQIVVYAAIIYFLFGPLLKLIKTITNYLKKKQTDYQTSFVMQEHDTKQEPEQTVEEEK